MKVNPDFGKMELIPAIIQDFFTKKVLMLAYVNKESYEYMQKNKKTCFYSRSRKKLWQKGGTSGNYQKIKEMYLDCDQDALLISVEQIGVACHTGVYSCFFNEEANFSEKEKINDNILQDLYEMIVDRKNNPKDKSYTNYLLNEGIDKICKKVGEEATETVIAAKNTDKDELIGEICDLIYHVEVLMYDRGVNIYDIKNKLTQRHKIEGNKKIENKKGNY